MTTKFETFLDFIEHREFIEWRLERTNDQDDYWFYFIKENPNLRDEFEKAILVFDKLKINERDFSNTDLLYKKVQQSISNNRKSKLRIIHYLTAAAAVLILIVGTLIFNTESISTDVTSEHIIGKTLPSEDVKLVLGNEVIILNKSSKIEAADGQLSYTDSTNTERTIQIEDVEINKLIVPKGKRSSLILADGSKVWINSGTELEFPSSFNESTREIYVNGEIYIEVNESKKQPFIVHTKGFDVEVFGTSFNVSSYDNEEETSVVLLEGSVEFKTSSQSLKMHPNEMVKLNVGNISKQDVDVRLYTSWIKGVFIFDRTPIFEVLKKVGRYYNISFSDIQNIPDKNITGKLYLSDNIDDVLSSISILTSSKYQRENNIIKLIK